MEGDQDVLGDLADIREAAEQDIEQAWQEAGRLLREAEAELLKAFFTHGGGLCDYGAAVHMVVEAAAMHSKGHELSTAAQAAAAVLCIG